MTKDDEALNDETEPAKVDATDEADTTDEPEQADDSADDVSAGDKALLADPPPRTLFRRLLVPVALAVLLLASIGVTTWFYLAQFRPDQQTNDAAKATVLQAAAAGTTSLLSYSPDTLDKDFANAKTHLTGDFLNYYTQFTHDIVTPAARDKAVKTSATVVQSGVSEMNPTSATVLLFLNQTTTSKENPDGSFTASSVKVGLTKVGNDWLINAFDPV
jgi:Mce-associated membrane protein